MTFQRTTALRIARADSRASSRNADRRRRLRSEPGARAPTKHAPDVEFIVRGEGEQTFRELLRALEAGARIRDDRRAVVSDGGRLRPQPRSADRAASHRGPLRLPNRGARVLDGYTLLGRPVDVVETSRGCTFDCSFCSIIEMRGRNFHTYPIERVLADIGDARRHGARAIFLVDDNITLDVRAVRSAVPGDHRQRLQRHRVFRPGDDVAARAARRDAGAADAPGGIPLRLSRHRERARRRSGVSEGAAPRTRAASDGRTVGNATIEAIEHLHRHGLFVVGGLIVGNPDDTPRLDRGQPGVRAPLRRLAVHPASDAVSAARR